MCYVLNMKFRKLIVGFFLQMLLVSQLWAQRVYSPNSVLATGSWFKISINAAGVYKMDIPFLASLGINTTNLMSSSIRLFGNGGQMLPEANALPRLDDLKENAILVVDGGDDVINGSDYILFYAAGPDEWLKDSINKRFNHQKNLFADKAYYFLNIGTNGKRINEAPLISSPTVSVNSFSECYFHELDSVNFLSSGKEWYGEELSSIPGRSLTKTFSLTIPNTTSGSPFGIQTNCVARSVGMNSRVEVRINNQLTNQIPINAVSGGLYDFFAQQGTSFGNGMVLTNNFDINYTYVPGSFNAQCWVNWFEIFARRNLILNGNDQLLFRDWNSVAIGNKAEFIISNANSATLVWDVTDPLNPVNMQGILAGNEFRFINNAERLHEYVAFNNNFLMPLAIGKITNQNLHNTSPIDFLIITHNSLIAQAQRLSQIHTQTDGLRIKIVTTEEIYNEFGSGTSDPTSIRDFIKMYYDKYNSSPNDKLRFVLLFGDASYDYKDRIKNNTNLVPSYQSSNSIDALATYTSDDFFGFLDNQEDINNTLVSNTLDVGIGRVPAKNPTEAKNFVDKVQSYLSVAALGPWRNNLVFIADDEDNNLHLQDAESITNTVAATAPVFNIQKIYLDAFHQESGAGGSSYPQANLAINNQINAGALIYNYNGHGGPFRLAEETILDASIVEDWHNAERLPLFITATCDFAPYDNPLVNSIGENILLRPQTGGIALMTTTRPVFAFSNRVMNNNYIKEAFQSNVQGKYQTLGDAIMNAKNATYQNSGDILNNRKFTLLGDPALTLAFPKTGIRITKVNNSIVPQIDTLHATDKVTIEGEVIDAGGNLQTSFNGNVFSLVLDKPQSVNTLANDPGSQVTTFQTQTNALFKGKTSVQNGKFNFTFRVPKDINFQYGKGKISLYAENGLIDVNGYFKEFYIGGIGTNNGNDNEGPSIKLYLNDERFVNGGITNQNPVLIAKLSDSSGINITGSGIGHDIVATLDDDNRRYFKLNDFFQSEPNSYQSGIVHFQLPELEPGVHTLKLKAWDVYNNSSESIIAFTVANDKELELKHILNYPNPFTTQTTFWFEHNKPGFPLKVSLQIMTITGKIVKTINQNMLTEGNRGTDILWDGKDEYGNRLGRGIYIYKLSVSVLGYKTQEKIEKLAIL